jgi:type I restriction-modification system DNA methylase subunit
MRLAGQEKMGYYPTPLSQVTLIASLLEVEPRKSVRLLDPCVGAGEQALVMKRKDVERGFYN